MRSVCEMRHRRNSVIPNPYVASASLFLAMTLGVLTLVVACIAVGLQTMNPLALAVALGDLGLQVVKDSSWLFSSFIATLLVVALLPKRLGTTEDFESTQRSLASLVLQAAPTLVGVFATSSLVLAIVGVGFHPSAAATLFAPVSLFVVILGLSYSVTSDLTASGPYRLNLVRNVLSACMAASLSTSEVIGEADRSRAPWRDVVVAAASWTLAGFSASFLLLVSEVAHRSGTAVFAELGSAALWLVAMSFLATGVGLLSSFVWWTSPREVSDRFLILYLQGLVLTSYGLLAWIVTQVPGGPSGIFVLLTCVIPLSSLWVPARFVPQLFRRLSLRRALATAALLSVLSREAAARKELGALIPVRSDHALEDRALLALLQTRRSWTGAGEEKS